MSEIIYVLTNEAMPGYVKVGKTSNNLEQRVKELSSTTSIPLPFIVSYACTVKDSAFVERQLHEAFGDNRVNPKREFFIVGTQRVVAALKLAEIENITPKRDFIEDNEDRESLNEVIKRRNRFNFKTVNIPIGTEIIFSTDKNIKAKVVDINSVYSIEFEGKKSSLSDSARKILGYSYPVSGTEYWMYDGETLDERRRRLENGE